jgi:GNAT superfamily N-acetyltransferase
MERATNVTIRPANADDLEFVVWVMLTAARSHLDRSFWELLYGKPESWVLDLLRRVAVSSEVHWCHLSKFHVAEVDGKRAGALTGFDPETEGTDVLSNAMTAVVGELADESLDFGAVLERAAIADRCTPKRYPGTWGVENVAVAPEMRGRGVLDRLMAHVLDQGRERGFRLAQIMCLAGNVRAQRAYEREGFRLKADYGSDEFETTFGDPGIKLLVQKL